MTQGDRMNCECEPPVLVTSLHCELCGPDPTIVTKHQTLTLSRCQALSDVVGACRTLSPNPEKVRCLLSLYQHVVGPYQVAVIFGISTELVIESFNCSGYTKGSSPGFRLFYSAPSSQSRYHAVCLCKQYLSSSSPGSQGSQAC